MDIISEGDKQYCTTCKKEQIIGEMISDFGGIASFCKVCKNDMDIWRPDE